MLESMPFVLPLAGIGLSIMYLRGALRARRTRRILDAATGGR